MGGLAEGSPFFSEPNHMSWMKYVAELAQDPTAVSSMRKALQTANKHGLNYAIYNSETISVEKLKAMITLVEKQQDKNDSLHRDPDYTNATE